MTAAATLPRAALLDRLVSWRRKEQDRDAADHVVHHNGPVANAETGDKRAQLAPTGLQIAGLRLTHQMAWTVRPYWQHPQAGGMRLPIPSAHFVVYEQGMTPTGGTRPTVAWRDPYAWDAGYEL